MASQSFPHCTPAPCPHNGRAGGGEMKSSVPYTLFTLPFLDTQRARQRSLHIDSAPSISLSYFNKVIGSFLQNQVLGWFCACSLSFSRLLTRDVLLSLGDPESEQGKDNWFRRKNSCHSWDKHEEKHILWKWYPSEGSSESGFSDISLLNRTDIFINTSYVRIRESWLARRSTQIRDCGSTLQFSTQIKTWMLAL